MTISKRELLYFIPVIVSLYILPMLITNEELGLIILPPLVFLLCIISTIFYALDLNSNLIYPIMSTLLYMPTNCMCYGKDLTYIVVFAILIFLGYFIGKGFSKFIYVKDIQKIS